YVGHTRRPDNLDWRSQGWGSVPRRARAWRHWSTWLFRFVSKRNADVPGQGPENRRIFPDWRIAVLIMVAILKRKQTKSAQSRFLAEQRRDLQAWLGMRRWPARSTYFGRYQRAHRLLRAAIKLQGEKAVGEGVADRESAWGYSQHDGWVQGYSFEVVVS